MKNFDKYISIKKTRIQAMHPVKDYFKKRKEIKKIQALEEAGRDILNTTITSQQTSTAGAVDKNNYKTYQSQVERSYQMYDAVCDYGAEILRGIVDTRVSFIMGEGLSVTCNNPDAEKFIEKMFNLNKLHGSRLLHFGLLGELEGKCLALLFPDVKKATIKIRALPYYTNPYTVNYNPLDTDEVQSVDYKPKKKDGETKNISGKNIVYIQTGGSGRYKQETPSRIHCVLTDIENFSRAKYDLRKNTHLFGGDMFFFQTDSMEAAAAINSAIQDKSWEVGDSYAGMAKLSILEPDGNGSDAILKDMLSSLKIISVMTGIPIHWLGYPELMSNRATADNLIQAIVSSTKRDRLVWEEGIREIIIKAIDMAIDSGIEKNNIKCDPDSIKVTLPLVSIELLKLMSEVWIPLWQGGLVSTETIMDKLPGINPYIEKERLKKQNEPEKNDGILKQLQTEDYDDSNEE